MGYITDQDANSLLANLGMKIGPWHEIFIQEKSTDELSSIGYQAPRTPLELYTFAQHAMTWIPEGQWKLLVTDNSNTLTKDAESLIGYLFTQQQGKNSESAYNVLFEYNNDTEKNYLLNIRISTAIYMLLLFEGHAYLTSETSKNLQAIGIQDGFVYFYGSREVIPKARKLLENFESAPTATPDWAC